MSKWADYGISAVRFNSAHTHIDRLRTHADNGETIGAAVEQRRLDIVDAIKKGTTFTTIFRNGNDKWKKGQPVYVVKIHGTEYIKTTDNGKAVDNLDNLSEL